MHSDQLLDEIESGQGETLARAAQRVPRTRQNRPVSMSCLLRWVLSGVAGPNDQRVYLEAARLAGKWVTTPGAIRRFIQAQTPQLAQPMPNRRTTAQRTRASERAAKELDRIGIRGK